MSTNPNQTEPTVTNPADRGHHGSEGERWRFDEGVAAAFDDMLRRSIPQHDEMRRLVHAVGRRFVALGTDVVDLGASRGDALSPLIDQFGALVRFHAVEVAPSMLTVLRQRFKGFIDASVVRVLDFDLRRDEYLGVRASLTLCVLALQFTPIEHRQRILRRVFDSTIYGGALVLVEKVLG